MSPFLDYRAEGGADLAALVARLRTLLDAGVDGVATLADDLGGEAPDGRVGETPARVVTEVLAAPGASHPRTVMWFVARIYDELGFPLATLREARCPHRRVCASVPTGCR